MIPGLHEFFGNLTYAVSLNNPLGLAALYAMGILTDIGIPLLLTLEIFLMFASYYNGPISLQVLLMVLMLLLGRETGGAILYWISRLVGEPFINWLQRHFPFFLRGLRTLRARVQKRVTFMTVVVRLTPGFLQVPSLLAGSLRLRYLSFVIGVAISSLIYDAGLIVFGFIARETLGNAGENLQDVFIIGFIVLIIIMWLILFFGFRDIFNDRDAKN